MEQEKGRETGLFSLRLIPRRVRRSEGVLAPTKPAALRSRSPIDTGAAGAAPCHGGPLTRAQG